jgi:hypothetical protein
MSGEEGEGGWGQKVLSRPSADSFAVGRRQKYRSVWGINISLQVIKLRKKKGSYSDIFEAVADLKFNLEIGRQFYRLGDCASRKIYISLGHKHLAPGNRVAEKEGFLLGRFRVR